jgi:hypothetical protein
VCQVVPLLTTRIASTEEHSFLSCEALLGIVSENNHKQLAAYATDDIVSTLKHNASLIGHPATSHQHSHQPSTILGSTIDHRSPRITNHHTNWNWRAGRKQNKFPVIFHKIIKQFPAISTCQPKQP